MKLLNKVKISLLIALFILLLLSIKTFAATGVITEITVNLREKPSTDSKRIMYVTQDDKVEVLEKHGDWYKIKTDGKIGYVFGKYLKVTGNVKDVLEENTNSEETNEDKNTSNIEEITQEVPKKLSIGAKTEVRLIPNITSNIIYTSKKDISVTIIEQINEWTYVSVDSISGWVRTDKIYEENTIDITKKETDETKESESTTIAYVKYDTVNLRQKASTSAKVLAKLKLNDKVTVIEKVNSTWSKIKVDGKTGYVSTELLSDKKQEIKETKSKDETNVTTSRDGETTSREDTKTEENIKQEEIVTKKEETTSTTNTTTTTISKKEESKETNSSKVTGEDIVAYAKKYLGYDYVYGGTSPSKGFDCSGFTYYVYKHFGYTLSRSSKAQANNGKKVAKSDLQLGDLLIFKNQSLTAIGHVGIYVGNNKMIHASEPGVGVTITDIDASGYNYNKRYVTARRII